jgi:hypothetical protein
VSGSTSDASSTSSPIRVPSPSTSACTPGDTTFVDAAVVPGVEPEIQEVPGWVVFYLHDTSGCRGKLLPYRAIAIPKTSSSSSTLKYTVTSFSL